MFSYKHPPGLSNGLLLTVNYFYTNPYLQWLKHEYIAKCNQDLAVLPLMHLASKIAGTTSRMWNFTKQLMNSEPMRPHVDIE